MAKQTNYKSAKRLKELERLKKRDEKKRRKTDDKDPTGSIEEPTPV